MSEFKMPDNRRRNGFLDDKTNAYLFFEGKKAIAREIIENIFSVTSGQSARPDDKDWVLKQLALLFETFTIYHKNFDSQSYANDLQDIAYDTSFRRFNAYLKWKRKAFADCGLDEDGETLPAEETPNVLDLSNHAAAEDDCIDLAKHISAVLNDERTPEKLRSYMKDGLCELDIPAGTLESPEYIAKILCQDE